MLHECRVGQPIVKGCICSLNLHRPFYISDMSCRAMHVHAHRQCRQAAESTHIMANLRNLMLNIMLHTCRLISMCGLFGSSKDPAASEGVCVIFCWPAISIPRSVEEALAL